MAFTTNACQLSHCLHTHLQSSAEFTVPVTLKLPCVNIFMRFILVRFRIFLFRVLISDISKKRHKLTNFNGVAFNNSITETDKNYKKLKTCISGFFKTAHDICSLN